MVRYLSFEPTGRCTCRAGTLWGNEVLPELGPTALKGRQRLTSLLNTGCPIASLGRVEQTLLIPLTARALARRLFPDRGFDDPAAEAIAARLAYDLTPFE